MFKRLPSRNNRSKGVRVKHVLQICLLLGVCFWLIYQVKHSHDKKKEFDTNDSKTSVRKSADSEIPKLGRKDLHRGEDVIKTEKHEEEEEEETSVEEEEKHEVEEQEEQNRHGVEEQEEEEAKNGETEEEGRGGGDDEIDENDQERKDGEGDRDEDFIDEEKEREDESDEKESEDKESQGENESSSEGKDNDGSTRNTHEAREENYKGDDASSAVTHNAHDTQNLSTETENVSSENTNENTETKNLEKQNKTDNSEDVNEHENKSELVVGEGGTADNGTSLNMIGGEQKVDNSSSNTVDGQGSETMQSNEQQEEGNKSILVTTKTSNDSTLVSIEASHNLTEKNNEMSDSSLQNGTQSVSYSDHPENVTIDGTTTGESVEALLLEGTNNTNTASEDNQSGFNSTEMENGSGDSGQFSDSSNKLKPDGDVSEKMFTSDVTTGAEEGYGLSVKGNTDATQNEKSDNGSDSDGTNESSDSTNGIEDSIQHDPIDSSDTHFTQDEKEVLTDLGTLPEIKTEGDDSEEVAAE